MERDAVGVKAGMESFREQVKQHDAFLVKYEMGTRNLRLEVGAPDMPQRMRLRHSCGRGAGLTGVKRAAKDALNSAFLTGGVGGSWRRNAPRRISTRWRRSGSWHAICNGPKTRCI
jgi:hypothetical protein